MIYKFNHLYYINTNNYLNLYLLRTIIHFFYNNTNKKSPKTEQTTLNLIYNFA